MTLNYLCYGKKTEKDYIDMIINDCWFIEYIADQKEAICLAAVEQNGLTLEYVKNQTDAICIAAVSNYWLALEHVKIQTKEICLIAIRSNGLALR